MSCKGFNLKGPPIFDIFIFQFNLKLISHTQHRTLRRQIVHPAETQLVSHSQVEENYSLNPWNLAGVLQQKTIISS